MNLVLRRGVVRVPRGAWLTPGGFTCQAGLSKRAEEGELNQFRKTKTNQFPDAAVPLARAAMPRYYCDYCDMYLTHDSSVGRKQHNYGWKHRENVSMHFNQFIVPGAGGAPRPAVMQGPPQGMMGGKGGKGMKGGKGFGGAPAWANPLEGMPNLGGKGGKGMKGGKGFGPPMGMPMGMMPQGTTRGKEAGWCARRGGHGVRACACVRVRACVRVCV